MKILTVIIKLLVTILKSHANELDKMVGTWYYFDKEKCTTLFLPVKITKKSNQYYIHLSTDDLKGDKAIENAKNKMSSGPFGHLDESEAVKFNESILVKHENGYEPIHYYFGYIINPDRLTNAQHEQRIYFEKGKLIYRISIFHNFRNTETNSYLYELIPKEQFDNKCRNYFKNRNKVIKDDEILENSKRLLLYEKLKKVIPNYKERMFHLKTKKNITKEEDDERDLLDRYYYPFLNADDQKKYLANDLNESKPDNGESEDNQ